MNSEDLARRAGKVAGWAARTGYTLGRRLPGAGTAERSLRSLERIAFSELRRRLEGVDDPYLAALADASSATAASKTRFSGNGQAAAATTTTTTAVVPDGDRPEPLRAAMAELLSRSVGFDREQARDYLYALILRQLTPDEARILSALSDGTPFPLLDIAERTSLGGAGRVVLRNASTVGKAAGVRLPDHVPAYLTRVIALGLADADEESPALDTQYEILLTDEVVRAAEEQVRRPKYVRGTVRISRLGAGFWQACDPTR
ncbi:Abi-alpha family protein [Qaidamihabitans albus]|uniref:Abi-alpha family protein n=1 Tax=Qaidamihabitans albus TaxID=2795733 RepID=UPI0018F14660|nr:Abi-alpha family protein [Qaidamihabitans albus]